MSPYRVTQSTKFKRLSPRQQLIATGRVPCLHKTGMESFRSSVNIPDVKLGQQRTRILVNSKDDSDAQNVIHRRVDNFLSEFGKEQLGMFDADSQTNPVIADSERGLKVHPFSKESVRYDQELDTNRMLVEDTINQQLLEIEKGDRFTRNSNT